MRDGDPALELAAGTVTAFTVPLPAVQVVATGSIPTQVGLSQDPSRLRRALDRLPLTGSVPIVATGSIEAQVVADDTGSVRLVGAAPDLRPGEYRLSFAAEGEDPQLSTMTMDVRRDGSIAFATKPVPPGATAPLRRRRHATAPLTPDRAEEERIEEEKARATGTVPRLPSDDGGA